MNSYIALTRRIAACTLACLLATAPAQAALELAAAIASAQAQDPWLSGSELREQALLARGTAASSLPDPMLSLGFANLPTDTFDFDQEPMTQFKVGVSQVFPRGDSRALGEKRFRLLSAAQPHQRADREHVSRWRLPGSGCRPIGPARRSPSLSVIVICSSNSWTWSKPATPRRWVAPDNRT